MTAAPLYCFASEHLGGYEGWDDMEWMWTRAHTDLSEIVPGTLTALQDWCDRSAPLGAELLSLTSEFYEYDVQFPLFCTKAGALPGLRKRLTSEVPSLLVEQAWGITCHAMLMPLIHHTHTLKMSCTSPDI